MTDRSVTMETRRALFRALVVSIASHEPEVTSRRIAVAVLRTGTVRSVCERAGVSADAIAEIVEGDRENRFAEVLERVEESLAQRGDFFGSRSHIESITPRPIEASTQRVLRRMSETKEFLSPVDVLLAVLESDPRIAEQCGRMGLTANVLGES